MENWSWIEVAWTLMAVTGAYFSANNIKDGITDLLALKKLDHNQIEIKIQKIVAWGNIRRDSLRIFAQGLFILLGLIAGIFIPESPDSGFSITRLVFQTSFFLVSGALTVSAIGDHFDRVNLQKLGILIGLRDNVQSGK